MTHNNEGITIPYGLYYLTVDGCSACHFKSEVEEHFKEIEELSGIDFHGINYVNVTHEKNPTHIGFRSVPTFIDCNEKGIYISSGRTWSNDGLEKYKIDTEWETWRFDEKTRQKMSEKRRQRTKEAIKESIKECDDCWMVYCRFCDEELVAECWKEEKGETVLINTEDGTVVIDKFE